MPSRDFTLVALDGTPLAATHVAPAASACGRPSFVVVGGATAVPRRFYRRFAEYLASRGVHVVTTDFRGIGDSKSMLPVDKRGRPTLAGYRMDYADWSRFDLAAADAYAAREGDVYLVGHSLGAHAFGQLPNLEMVQAAWFCGSGAGWAGWMPPAERAKVWLLWNVVGPVATRWLGYQPMSRFGIGEDVPLGVYRDWKRWCRFPRYFFDDPADDARALVARFSDIRCPVAASNSTDDLWAMPRSRDAFFSGYTGTEVEAVDLVPSTLGVASVGHMGYFRPAVGVRLWPRIAAWLARHGMRIAPVRPEASMPQA